MGIDLVTKAEYKAYANINSTNQDAQIDAIIPIVSQLVKTICRRTFVDYVSDAKTEVFSGGAYLDLSEYPLIALQGVEYSSDYGANYSDMAEYTDYVYDAQDNCIKPIIRTEFPTAINAYRVTYTAGYEELPEDLKVAVLDLISYYLKNDMSVHSPKAPGTNSVQIEYVTTTALPAHIKRILDQYVANYL